jgi:DNA-binding FadR family transcriptional regulator
MAESVAAQIEQEIIDLGWPIGRIIGSEAELMERFNVSRAVLREAIRLLEHHHVAKMRRGPGGGLQIAEPEPHAVARAAALYLGYRGVGARQLLEARMTIEGHCVELAAQRLDETGIARLRRSLEEEQHPQPSGMEIHQLHLVIADLAGNEALRLFVDVLTTLTRTILTPDVRPQVRRGDFQPDAHRVHELIVEALIAGDVPLARHRMRRHIEAIGRYVPPE